MRTLPCARCRDLGTFEGHPCRCTKPCVKCAQIDRGVHGACLSCLRVARAYERSPEWAERRQVLLELLDATVRAIARGTPLVQRTRIT